MDGQRMTRVPEVARKTFLAGKQKFLLSEIYQQQCSLHNKTKNSQDSIRPPAGPKTEFLDVGMPGTNFGYPDHVIRAYHEWARYETNPDSKRKSVVIPLDHIQPGSDSVTILLSFMCQNSCPGGMNRRATVLIFTLENSSCEVLGRRTVQFCVSSCPKRDLEKQESSKLRNVLETKVEKRLSPETSNSMNGILTSKEFASKKLKSDGEFVYIPVLESIIPTFVKIAHGMLLSNSDLDGCSLTPLENELKTQYVKVLSFEATTPDRKQ